MIQPNYDSEARAILTTMRPVEARYEDGVHKSEELRGPDPARWNLQRLGAAAAEDAELAAAGLDDWADTMGGEDH